MQLSLNRLFLFILILHLVESSLTSVVITMSIIAIFFVRESMFKCLFDKKVQREIVLTA